jgi:hypothetical protein
MHLTLTQLLEAHDKDKSATSLSENLGDGALFTRNRVFNVIRSVANSAGCRFTTHDEHGYFAWALTALPRILETRTIPYRRTFDAVAALEKTRPGFFTTKHTEDVEIQGNVVLHESAHCVADSVWEKQKPALSKLSRSHRIVLKYAVAEAFANTTELAAMSCAKAPVDQWLLALNSYWGHIPKLAAFWSTLISFRGPQFPVRWLMMCFLSANLQRNELPHSLRADLLNGGEKPSRGIHTALDFLAHEAFSLNVDFRRNTFVMFFASLGLEPNAATLSRFDFVEALKADPRLALVIDDLVAILSESK